MKKWIALMLVLAACAAQPSPSGSFEYATFDADPADGNWRYLYPDQHHLHSQGRIAEGRRVGEWSYFYRDGRPLARGRFGGNGLMQGLWIFW